MDALDSFLDRIARGREQAKAAGMQAPQYKCNICEDTGFVIIKNKHGADYGARCQCYEKKTALRLMAASGIREEDTKRGFDGFNTFNEPQLMKAKQTAAKYCMDFEKIRDERHNSLLLCGASGRGKTTLGMAVANNLIHRCIGVRYMPYRDEVTALKQVVVDEENYNNRMHRLKSARVLFVDDMLKGKLTESDINIMYEIINYRYLERLPVIISTEKTTNELLEFDEAIGSRVLEMCKGYVVTFDKSIPNYRMR